MRLIKSKKGQKVMVGVMVAIMLLIAIMQFVKPIKEVIVDTRSTDNLDCDNSSITDGTKSACIVVDYSLFYWFGISLAVAVGGGVGMFAKKRQ